MKSFLEFCEIRGLHSQEIATRAAYHAYLVSSAQLFEDFCTYKATPELLELRERMIAARRKGVLKEVPDEEEDE